MVLKKETVLLGILQKRQNFNEIKTIRAVENCRRLVSEEIEGFFEQKEGIINSLLPELIIGTKSYSNIFNNNDLDRIYKQTEKCIKDALLKRFNRSIIWKINNANFSDWISNILSPIEKYQKTKKRTVLITSYMETLSRRTLSDSIDLLMGNSLITKLLCNIDISVIMLPKLGINSNYENMELNEELINRIGGALYSIKLGLVQEMNNQISNIFYETHDLLLNTTVEHKIILLEEKIAREEICHETNLMEA